MRVLYLNPFSQQVSGPDESLLSLLGAIIPLGIEAHVALPRPGPSVARYEALGVKVHYLPLTFLKRRMRIIEALSLPFRLIRGALAVARLVKRERIHLIHTNMEVVLDGSVASRFLRVPHVLHYRGNTQDSPKIVFDLLTRFWTLTSERIICISKATAGIFERRGLGGTVLALHNPVELDRFRVAVRSDEVRRQFGASEGDLLVGTIGRVHPRKDVATFLHACALALREVPRLKAVVVGGAEAPEEIRYEAELRALASQLGIEDRVTWAGARRDVPEVLKALDIFLLCSRHEGFGRVVAEAMAAGRPVIASREGAPIELIEEGRTGMLATPADPGAFAERIRALGHNPQLMARLGESGVTESGRFDSGAYAQRVQDEYVTLLALAAPRG